MFIVGYTPDLHADLLLPLKHSPHLRAMNGRRQFSGNDEFLFGTRLGWGRAVKPERSLQRAQHEVISSHNA